MFLWVNLTICFPWVSMAFSSCCSLKLRRLTLSGSTFKHSSNPPLGFPA
uniref:Phosphoinositide phospholipase C n=1 Tax=Rhizophora mucronata TaxID=61149 RepID=A0A2P2NLY7_RHIMU